MSSRFLAHFLAHGVSVNAELASGAGAALNASVLIVPRAELASGTGTAHDATASTALNVSVDAELAGGSGVAQGLTASIAPNAEAATGTGAASNATVRLGQYAPAGAASGTGAAQNATTLSGPTRFYLNTRGWPQVRPDVDSGWENANLALETWHSRRVMRTWHGGSAEISPFGIDNQAAIHDLLMAQYISEPLAAQTINGTIRAVVQAAENNSAANMRSQMHAWVMKPDGTSRGTLTTFTTGALASEWNTSRRSAFFPVGSTGTTVSSVAAQLGDRIVVDLGARIHDTTATQYNGRLYLGDGKFSSPGTSWDLPSDQTNTTTTRNGWVEFSAGLVFQTTPTAIVDDIANAIDCMPAAEGSVTAYAADISGFTTESDDPDSMFDVNYSGDLGFTGWTKLVGPAGGARVKVEGGGGLAVEPFIYVFDDPPTSGSSYELYNETADPSTGVILIDVPDGVTKYVAIMPGDGSFEDFGTGDTDVYLEFTRARVGELADLIADAPDLMPATENSDTVAFSPDVDFWTTETDDPQYLIDNIADPLGFTGWFKLDVPAGPGSKVVDIGTYLPIDYAEGPENTALFVFNEVPTLSSVPIAEAYFSPDGSPPAGSIDQSWGGKAKIPDLELSSGATYYVAVVPLDGSFWEHWDEGNNLQVTVHRQLDSADVNVFPGLATGTGQAFDAAAAGDRSVYDVGDPSGSGSALSARALISANAGTGAGAGAAEDATASDIFRTYAPAGTATGTGSALGPRATVAPHLGALGGVGAAHNAAPNAYAVDDTVEGDIPTGYMPPLAAPIDDNDTTLTVTTPMGSTPDLPFVIVIDGEQILVTDISPDGLTWTIERAYDGSTAVSHNAGAIARPSLVRIRVDGVLISADVNYQRSRFTTGANGQAGVAEIWVRDLDRTWSFTTGAEVRVSFRGVHQWGGYLAAIRRQYVFPEGTGNIGDEPRWLILDCVDYNVLFNKRVFAKYGDLDHMAVKHWPNGTWDAVVISDMVNDLLSLGDDGLKYDIQHVGTPALPQISCNPDAPDVFGIGSAGWTWGEVMNAIVSQTGAVYYIDPDKVFRYVDDSTKQSRFGFGGVTDSPTVGGPSITGGTDSFTRTVSGSFGTGPLGTWSDGSSGSATLAVDGAEAVATFSGGFGQSWNEVSIAAAGVHTAVARIKWPATIDDEGDAHGLEFFVADFSTDIGVYKEGDGDLNLFVYLDPFYEEAVVSVGSPTPGAWAYLKLQVDLTSGELRAKYWEEGDPEPGWQAELGPFAEVVDAPVDLFAMAYNRPSSSATVRWDEVEYEGFTEPEGSGLALIGYRDVEFTSDGARLLNDHYQWGAGQGSSSMVFAHVEDEDSIADHGRWQGGELRFDLYCQDSVDRRAETWVYGSPQNRRGGKDDRFFSRVTVREPYFRVADVIDVVSNEFGFTRVVPVRNAEITFPTPWDIRCVLTMAHELDAPWSTFEFWIPTFDFDLPDFGFPAFPGFPPFPPIPDPWGSIDQCEEVGNCVVTDTFTRSSWGSTDTGELWTASGDILGVPNGSEALLADQPGRVIGAVSQGDFESGIARIDPVAISLPDVLFTFHYSGTWESQFAYNEDTNNPGTYHGPGFVAPPSTSLYRPSSSNWQQAYLSIMTRQSIPIGQFRVYNAEGGLWITHWMENSVIPYSVDIPSGPYAALQADVRYRVRIHCDSDQMHIRIWPEGSTEPTFWHHSTRAGWFGTWDEADPKLIITASDGGRNITQPPYEFFIDDLCIGARTYAGEALGLPGFATTGPGWSGGWTDYDIVVGGTKHLTDPANISMSGGQGSIISYSQDANNGVGGVALNLGPPFDPTEPHSVLIAMTILDTGSNWAFRVGVAGEPGGAGGTYTERGWATTTLTSPITAGDYLCRVGVTAGGAVTGRIWEASGSEPGSSNMIIGQHSLTATPIERIIQIWLRNDSNTIPVDLAQINITSIEVNGDSFGTTTDTSNCEDAFDEGGLIAAWGSPGGSPGGSWVILDEFYISQPEAFSGNTITEGIYGSDVNDLYYGGVTYLSGATYPDIHSFLVTFVVSPSDIASGPSSYNQMQIGYASTPAALSSYSFGTNAYMAVYWNNTIHPPGEGYRVAGVGNFPRNVAEGVMYAARFRVDQTSGAVEYKFWEPGTEDEPGYSTGVSLSVGQVGAIKIGLNGGNVWPAGTRAEVNGVTYWLGYGEDAAVPVAPGNSGCIDCGDAAPGEFEDPLHDGPEVGDEPGDRLSEVGDNGGIVFQLNAQFQLGSTEVWVDGLRIRLGSDYLEFPRNGKIEILDHVDVGTEEDPATIRVNYIIWTIDDPIPE